MWEFNESRLKTLSTCCWEVIDENLECGWCWRYSDEDILF